QLLQGVAAFQLKADVEADAFARRRALDQLARAVVPAGHDQRKIGKALHLEAPLLHARVVGTTDQVDRFREQMGVLDQRIERRVGDDGKAQFAAAELTQRTRCESLEQAKLHLRV